MHVCMNLLFTLTYAYRIYPIAQVDTATAIAGGRRGSPLMRQAPASPSSQIYTMRQPTTTTTTAQDFDI